MSIIGGFGVPTPPSKKTSEEYPVTPWKYIAIAAIAAASILGLIAATTLFNTNPAATTSTGWQPPPEPANPGGWIPPNEPDDTEATPTPTEIPTTPIEIPKKPIWDLNNLPKEIPYRYWYDEYCDNKLYTVGLYITDLKIGNGEISGTIENRQIKAVAVLYNPKGEEIVRTQGYTLRCFQIKLCKNSKGDVYHYVREMKDPLSTVPPKGEEIHWTGGLQAKDNNGNVNIIIIPYKEKVHFKADFPEIIEKMMVEDQIHYIAFY